VYAESRGVMMPFGLEVPAPVWQSPQHTLRAAEKRPNVPMNSSTGIPFSTWTFLKIVSGRLPSRLRLNPTLPNDHTSERQNSTQPRDCTGKHQSFDETFIDTSPHVPIILSAVQKIPEGYAKPIPTPAPHVRNALPSTRLRNSILASASSFRQVLLQRLTGIQSRGRQAPLRTTAPVKGFR